MSTPLRLPAHLPALDGLRALAILLVIPHNVSVLSGHLPAFAYPLAMVANVGWIGVQLFFTLSGFLITGYLLDTQRATNYYEAFFGRRILRIFPLYYGMCVLLLLIVPATGHAPDDLMASKHNQFWLWTFLSNWAAPFDKTVTGFSHFWSLAIEEQFYLVWPFLVHRRSPPVLLKWCVGVVVAALIVRIALVFAGASHGELYMFTICRMDALVAGAAGAALLRMPAPRAWIERHALRLTWGASLLLLVGAVPTGLYGVEATPTQTYGYTILAVGFAALVTLSALPPVTGVVSAWSILASRPLRAIGRYSYAMYVFHMPLQVFVGLPLLHARMPQISPAFAIVYVIAITVVTFVLGALSYRFFENPFLKFKARFAPRFAASDAA